MTRRQIVAMGGGGFSMEPDNPLLDDYVLDLCRAERPRVVFVPTASGDNDDYIVRFYAAFTRRECLPSHLPLFRRTEPDFRWLLDVDVIYVGGGNTANMLAVWRVHGVDQALREAWEAGVILTGLSAGAICWFEGGVTDSFAPGLTRLDDGLGLIAGTACPHYDGDAERRPAYHRLIAEGFPGGYAADDGAALHFVDGELHRAVSSRKEARAYRVAARGGEVDEQVIDTEYLGGVAIA